MVFEWFGSKTAEMWKFQRLKVGRGNRARRDFTNGGGLAL